MRRGKSDAERARPRVAGEQLVLACHGQSDVLEASELAAIGMRRVADSARRDPATHFIERQHVSTQPTYRQALDVCAEILSGGRCKRTTLPWHLVDYSNGVRLRSELARRYKPSSVNKILAAFRGVLREVWELSGRTELRGVDFVALEQARRVRNVHDEALPAGVPLDYDELEELFEVCEADPRPAGRRDAALLAVLRQTGARRFEVSALDLDDYDRTSGEVRLRIMKRGKQRMSVIAAAERERLREWLTVRSETPGPLFCRIDRHGRVRIARLSGKGIWRVVVQRCEEARIRRHGPHDLRHTMATHLHAAGVGLRDIQERMGHSQITTTQRYTHVNGEALRRGAELLSVPRGTRGRR